MGFWDSVLNVVENVPIAGHVTSLVHLATGNKVGAQRAFAASTGNLVSTVGAVGGFAIGGPAGAVAGGALGGTVGGQLKNALNGEKLELTPTRLITDGAIGGLSGLTGGAASAAGGAVTSVAKDIVKEGAVAVGRSLGTAAAGQVVTQSLLGQAVKNTKGLGPKLEQLPGDDDPAGPKLVRVITQGQAAKARAFEQHHANLVTPGLQLDARLASNIANVGDLGGDAHLINAAGNMNIGDLGGNLAMVTSFLIQPRLHWTPAMAQWTISYNHYMTASEERFLNAGMVITHVHGAQQWQALWATISRQVQLLSELDTLMKTEQEWIEV